MNVESKVLLFLQCPFESFWSPKYQCIVRPQKGKNSMISTMLILGKMSDVNIVLTKTL